MAVIWAVYHEPEITVSLEKNERKMALALKAIPLHTSFPNIPRGNLDNVFDKRCLIFTSHRILFRLMLAREE